MVIVNKPRLIETEIKHILYSVIEEIGRQKIQAEIAVRVVWKVYWYHNEEIYCNTGFSVEPWVWRNNSIIIRGSPTFYTYNLYFIIRKESATQKWFGSRCNYTKFTKLNDKPL